MSTSSLFDRLEAGGQLPTLPGVVVRLLEVTRQPDVSSRQVTDTIALDPGLSAKIQRFVKSPLAGVRHELTSLQQAVALVGIRGVNMMALSFSVLSSGRPTACDRFDHKHFVLHSLACGCAARALSARTRLGWTQEAFVAGLLSQLGRLALATVLREEYSTILTAARRIPEDLPKLERAALGETYATVGAWLLRNWGIPEKLCGAIEIFRDDDRQSGKPGLPEILRTAELAAGVLCSEAGGEPPDSSRFVQAAQSRFALDAEQCLEIIRTASTELQDLGQLFDLPDARMRSIEQIEAEVRERLAELTVAMHLENRTMALRQEDLLRRATTDALTGVGNRAAFDARMLLELERVARSGGPFALLMIDVDRFKDLNDKYGHQAGDRVLQNVAHLLDQNVRKVDYVARYGGEEFAVIAPSTGEDGVANLAERLRRTIESTPVTWEGHTLKATISIGAAVFHEVSDSGDAPKIIKVADERLYAAKYAGRNRVAIMGEADSQEYCARERRAAHPPDARG
jgi:diguanylate cyclase (GGDEF)-like protein